MTKKCSRSLYLIDDDCNQQYGKVGCSEKSLRSFQVFTNNWEIWNNDFLLTLNISLVFVMVASDFFSCTLGLLQQTESWKKKSSRSQQIVLDIFQTVIFLFVQIFPQRLLQVCCVSANYSEAHLDFCNRFGLRPHYFERFLLTLQFLKPKDCLEFLSRCCWTFSDPLEHFCNILTLINEIDWYNLNRFSRRFNKILTSRFGHIFIVCLIEIFPNLLR